MPTVSNPRSDPAKRAAAYATFRPRRSRIVSIVAAVATVVVFAIVGIQVPRGGENGWSGQDSVALVVFGVAIALFLLRYALVHAKPTESGLHVQNLISSRDIPWAEIVNVQFGGGPPWLILELADTETLSVMAVQRSDGDRAMAEAQRLAALVDAHNHTARDD
ncbi:PH domain-containing protein [Flexivirga meconopsidis]|uniref:PH domain-containing protein n=1 Tax=Flexivirga meconopsidis TaxID=2977121 RepID=UPI00223F88E9|nr:PH domain-containing protein [Flexivirga meconopsidis]